MTNISTHIYKSHTFGWALHAYTDLHTHTHKHKHTYIHRYTPRIAWTGSLTLKQAKQLNVVLNSWFRPVWDGTPRLWLLRATIAVLLEQFSGTDSTPVSPLASAATPVSCVTSRVYGCYEHVNLWKCKTAVEFQRNVQKGNFLCLLSLKFMWRDIFFFVFTVAVNFLKIKLCSMQLKKL